MNSRDRLQRRGVGQRNFTFAGRTYPVADGDAVGLAAAVILAIEYGSAEWSLASGDTVPLTAADLPDICRQLAAPKE